MIAGILTHSLITDVSSAAGMCYSSIISASALAKMLPEETFHACGHSRDPAAWKEFVRLFHRLIATIAMRTARRWGEPSPQLIDDLIQETYLKLCADRCRLLREFEPQHSDAVFGFLKVVTANVVHDHFKALHAMKRGQGLDPEPAEKAERTAGRGDPGTPEAIERAVLIEEIDACLRSCGSDAVHERDRRIFWLYYRHGMSARAISSLPSVGLSTTGVESAISRLTRFVRNEITERRVSAILQGGQTAEKGIRSEKSL